MNAETLWSGMFWSPADGRRSRGELSSDDRWFNLKLTSDVVTSLTHSVSHPGSETMVGITREPALVVADFEPRVLHGELGDGTAVTILDGHLDSGPFGEQSFSAHRLIWGAHLPESPTFSSVRFAPPGQRGWHGLVGEASCGGAIPRGRLKGSHEGSMHLVEYECEEALTLSSAESLVWHSASALMSLWCNQELHPSSVQLRLTETSPWLELDTSGLRSSSNNGISDPLLPPARMTLQLLADWLDLAARISPVHYIISSSGGHGASIQVQVLSLASALEGLHRRTHPAQDFFESLSPSVMKSVRKAAADAALARLEEVGFDAVDEAQVRIRQSLAHMGQTTLADRLLPLAKQANRVAPGLLGPSLDEWVKGLKEARNDQGHQLEAAPEFGAEKFDPYYQYLISARWVGRIALLILAGVSEDDIRAALAHHTPFHYDLANMDTSLHGWDGSSLDVFREAAEGWAVFVKVDEASGS